MDIALYKSKVTIFVVSAAALNSCFEQTHNRKYNADNQQILSFKFEIHVSLNHITYYMIFVDTIKSICITCILKVFDDQFKLSLKLV